MRGFNKVILMGNLTRDPQLKYLPSQTAVAEFGLAMNRRFRDAQGQDREEVCFVDCAAFGKTGEFINNYFKKGKPILLEGRLKLDQWDDKQGGGKRSKLSVIVETASFVGGGPGEGGPGGGGGGNYDNVDTGPRASNRGPAPGPTSRPAGAAAADASGAPSQPFTEEQHFKEDDIPF
jgi:single-strand DNA-binding protein